MKHNKNTSIILICVLIFILSLCLGISFGSSGLSFKSLWNAVLTGDIASVSYRIFFYVRLPRVIAACFSGMALAVSGVIIQGILNNPLAGPNIIGVNSGAGFGAMLAMSLIPFNSSSVPLMAFIGALLTTLTVFAIASKTGAGKVTVILAGVAISSILSAGTDTLKTVFPDTVIDGSSFLIGGFTGVSYDRIFPAVYYIIAGLITAFVMSRIIDIMGLGDEEASTLGVNVKLNRFVLMLCASCLAGAAVSFSGLLGFVGLIVPHIVRRFTGNSHKILIPCSALLGGTFVILCDLLSRIIFAPYEIPVGIIMSLIGGPFFIFLLLRQNL